MDTFLQDLKYAFRMLRKNPGFTAVAVLTLALGIGANSAIFSVVNAVLLRPLPYPQSDRLVFLSESSEDIPDMSIAMANFNDWRAQNMVFEELGAYQNSDAVITGRGEAEWVRMRRVSADLFPTLRVQPIAGRPLRPDDDQVGAAPVVLLGEGYWERRFGRDPNALGQTLRIDGEVFSIIGIMPANLHASWRKTDIFTSLWRLEDQMGGEKNRGNHPGIYAYARLKPSVTVAQAGIEMKNIAARLDELHPATNGKQSAGVQPLLSTIVEDVRPPLLLLTGAVGFVLLIACVNIANLLLSRAAGRHRELAVRVALGASRMRLMRQTLTESVLLSLVGGLLGLLSSLWLTAVMLHWTPAGIPRLSEVCVDLPVLLFTLGLSVLTGLFFGLFPAWQASRANIQSVLKEGSRTGSDSGSRLHLRNILVGAEVGISLVLVVGAGLMSKSLFQVLRADGGFNPDNVMTAKFNLPDAAYKEEAKQITFVNQVVQKVQSIPGVEAAGSTLPLLGGWQAGFQIEGRPQPPPGQAPSTDIGRVTQDTMRAMGMRLDRGRHFDAHDNESSAPVCIIDESFAHKYFANSDPIGQHLSIDGPPAPGKPTRWISIIGVAAHVKNYGVDQPSRVEMYVPASQRPVTAGTLVVRMTSSKPDLPEQIRAAVHSVDPDVPLFDIRPLSDVVGEGTAPRRLSVVLVGAFAVLALFLAAVGIYGVMAYNVTQRNREIGIRMALGAGQKDVLAMVVRQGVGPALAGIGVGLLLAYGLARVLASLLFQVRPFDPAMFAAGPLVVTLVVVAACWLPGRRASRVDPIVALRDE